MKNSVVNSPVFYVALGMLLAFTMIGVMVTVLSRDVYATDVRILPNSDISVKLSLALPRSSAESQTTEAATSLLTPTAVSRESKLLNDRGNVIQNKLSEALERSKGTAVAIVPRHTSVVSQIPRTLPAEAVAVNAPTNAAANVTKPNAVNTVFVVNTPAPQPTVAPAPNAPPAQVRIAPQERTTPLPLPVTTPEPPPIPTESRPVIARPTPFPARPTFQATRFVTPVFPRPTREPAVEPTEQPTRDVRAILATRQAQLTVTPTRPVDQQPSPRPTRTSLPTLTPRPSVRPTRISNDPRITPTPQPPAPMPTQDDTRPQPPSPTRRPRP